MTTPTRPLYWSVRRELWENKSVYVAPLAAAAVLLFGYAISTITLPRRVQALQHLEHDRHADLGRHVLPALARPHDQLGERFAVHVLHGEEHFVVGGDDVEWLHDVRVTDARGEARLFVHHRAALGILRHVRQEPLDRDRLLEATFRRHATEVNLRHTARSHRSEETVAADLKHEALAFAHSDRGLCHTQRLSGLNSAEVDSRRESSSLVQKPYITPMSGPTDGTNELPNAKFVRRPPRSTRCEGSM